MAEVIPMHLSHARGASFAARREELPNPAFSFPMKPLEGDQPAADAVPRSASEAAPSQPARQPGLSSRRTASALPSFSFNPSSMETPGPSVSAPDAAPSTPPLLPTLPIPITSRNLGHRRGGSEFIGGDGRTGGTGLLSTSPTKGDGALPAPAAPLRPGPPAGRRGHAHKRSGAVSCHDLQTILQSTSASAVPMGGSAPVTPLDAGTPAYFTSHSRRSASQSSFKTPSEPSSPPNEPADSSPRKGFSRPRVGFSDQLEFIRPLSTISSGTESSMSTIRGGHSVNGSLSSVLSASTASPSSVRTGRPSLQTTFEEENQADRPRTASDILDSVSVGKLEFGQSLSLPERPRSAISATEAAGETTSPSTPTNESPVKAKPSKKRHFGWFDQRRQGQRHSRDRSASLPASKSEPTLIVTPPDTPDTELGNVLEAMSFSALSVDQDKKPRKSRSWAHSLMSLRHRQKAVADDADDELSMGTASGVTTPGEDLDFAVVADFDADNTVDIVTAPELRPVPVKYSASSPASFSSMSSSSPSDTMSPIIDLDAALAPFSQSSGTSSHHRALQRRSMHSSGGLGNNVFGLPQQHRRTESAPALVPFESRGTKMASSTMADVFEEEEEHEYSPKRHRKTAAGPVAISEEESNDDAGLGIQVSESTQEPIAPGPNVAQDNGLRRPPPLAQSPPASPVTRSPMLSSTQVTRQPHGVGSVQVVEDFQEPGSLSLTRDSDSTVTPEATDDEAKRPCPPLQLNMPMVPPAMMTPDTLASSPMSTLEYRRGSRPSFELPRVGTAASSFTDTRTVSSFALGEPGPDFRCSVDDVPSLTSSRSTMTSTPHHPLSQAHSYADARSVSVGSRPSAGMERARKRGSIASLSRLISGESFATRSKLSIETRPMSEHKGAGEQAGGKKKNRISRLMAFWKSKERLNS